MKKNCKIWKGDIYSVLCECRRIYKTRKETASKMVNGIEEYFKRKLDIDFFNSSFLLVKGTIFYQLVVESGIKEFVKDYLNYAELRSWMDKVFVYNAITLKMPLLNGKEELVLALKFSKPQLEEILLTMLSFSEYCKREDDEIKFIVDGKLYPQCLVFRDER